MRWIKRWAVLLLGATVIGGCAGPRTDLATTEDGTRFSASPHSITAKRYMAAAANPIAADIGRDILRAGGSAVDAAIAIQLALTIVEPNSSGIGGGAFLMHWDGQRVRAFDGRETAPLAATENLFLTPEGKPLAFYDAVVGGRSVGTPGVLRMLELAHREYGKLSWARLFEPAIKLAEDGFAISPLLYTTLKNEKYLVNDANAAKLFYEPNGEPRAIGSVIRNPALAATLRDIAQRGADAFYSGPIAADIVRTVRSHPNAGYLAENDLAAYRAKERQAVCSDYKRYRLCGMPPPSSGGIAIAQIFGMLAQRNIATVPPIAQPNANEARLELQPDAVHLLSEIERLAFADRGLYVADSDFVFVDVNGLIDARYLAQRAVLITDRSMGRAEPGTPSGVKSAYAPDPSPLKTATSHISVVDADGHAVSMTTSIEDNFGARLMTRGFLLNNQLTDFSFAPNDAGKPIANRVQPGKRPRSSMSPTLVFDRQTGQLLASVGSPGGSQIIGYVARTLVGVLDWNLDIQTAINMPNFGSRNGPTELEKGRFSADLVNALRTRGHDVREIEMMSGLQGIVRVRLPDGSMGWSGGADPRREGVARGD
ncbi:MAG TPA: gamma-glutamyltransferase [Burkholderiaceae bacterium]|nr:gamma-glutamyltransferase [Burkholderiaceae bacterium]